MAKEYIDTRVLHDIGLTEAQIKVYMSLLKLHEAKSGEIIKKSGLQSSVVYNSLNSLIDHGLVSFSKKGNIKYFFATDPQNLITFVDDKREKIKDLVPQLIRTQNRYKPKQEAEVFVGWKGLKNAYNKVLELLHEGEEYIAFGSGFEEQFNEEARNFFRELQKKRALKKYDTKLIMNESARKQVENYGWYEGFKKPKWRFVPGFAPIGITIAKDHVLNVAFGEQPVAILIGSKEISDSFRRCFYNMWKIAEN